MSDSASLISTYTQAIATQPHLLANYWHLGLAWLLQGDEAEAQAAWFSAAMAVDPEIVEAGLPDLLELLRAEAAEQLAAGQYLTAERIYQQVLELGGTATDALALGSAVSQQGRYEEAIEHWQSAIKWQPDCTLAHVKQAEVWQKLGQLTEAIAAYRRASELGAEGQTHYQLGLCLAAQEQWQAASEQFQRAQQPEWAELYGDWGWALLQSGEPEAAIEQFQQVFRELSHEALQFPYAQLEQKLAEARRVEKPPIAARCKPASQTVAPAPSPTQPIGFYETAQAWAAAQPTHVYPDTYVPLDAAQLVCLTPPKTLDAEIHFSFRFGQAIELPNTFVATIPNGRFWLSADQTSSAVLTAANWLIGDLSPQFPLLSPGHPDQHPSRQLHPPIADPLQKVDGTVAVLAGLTNDLYFHWMLDVLPRWNLLQRSGFKLSQIDNILVSNRLPFQQETLERLGVPAAKILPVEQHRHLQADRLIVPSYPGVPAWMPRWACDWLRQLLLTDTSQTKTRLYISRRQAARRILNEAAVIDLLAAYGFQSVVLETLSVQAQAKLLASVEVVISAHGGGLTNLVFCRPQTKVIELFSPRYVYPCYWFVSNLMELQYHYLLGKTPAGLYLDRLLCSDDRLADIWIDLAELRSLLALADVDLLALS